MCLVYNGEQALAGLTLLDWPLPGLLFFFSMRVSTEPTTCDRALWLEQGEIQAEGEAGLVVEEYLDSQGQP
jgi:hypothetical protein